MKPQTKRLWAKLLDILNGLQEIVFGWKFLPVVFKRMRFPIQELSPDSKQVVRL